MDGVTRPVYFLAEQSQHGGWFRTGDLGRLTPEGNLLLTGRVKEMINRGGVKINPLDVRCVDEAA